MLEQLCIGRYFAQSRINHISIGRLAASMLFYNKVIIPADYSTFAYLASEFGPELLAEYLARGYLAIEYLGNNIGVRTQNSGTTQELHDPIVFSVERTQFPSGIEDALQRSMGSAGKARRAAARLIPLIETHQFEQGFGVEVGKDYCNGEYIEAAILHILAEYVPDYPIPEPFFFRCLQEGTGRFRVETNIDYRLVNQFYHRRVSSSHSTLNSAYLLSLLQDALAGIYFSNRYSCEVMTASDIQSLMHIKLGRAAERLSGDTAGLSRFQSEVIVDCPDLASVINDKRRSLAELLVLLDKAASFRSWVQGKPADADLLREYVKELGKVSFSESMPGTLAKWSLFNMAGLGLDLSIGGAIGTVSALSVSAIDQFFVSRYLAKNKVTAFINNELRPFLSGGGRW